MKILFSNPPGWAAGDERDGRIELRQWVRAGSRWPFSRGAHFPPDQYRAGGYYPFPFFMGYAASYCQKVFPDDFVIFRDSIVRGESYRKFQEYVLAIKPDWIVVESATSSWEHDKRLLGRIAAWLPEAKIILTGTIASSKAEGILDSHIVACVQGEYEKGIVRVIRGERGLIAHDIMTGKEMNEAPIPMLDDEVWDRWWDANPKGSIFPQLQLWASRGCFAVCSFCSWPAIMTNNDPMGEGGRKIRFYSPEKYIEPYIREMLGRHPYKSVYFDDDTGNLADRHVLGLCAVMKQISIPWGMMCRADTIERATWQAMRDSGCYGVKLGFESGSQRVVDEIVNKRLDLKAARETAIWLRSIGLSVHGTFTIGLPGERPEEVQMTHDFIKKLYVDGGLDTHQLSGTATLDGTPLANMKQGEALKNFPGAVKPQGWVDNPDGHAKLEKMGT